MAGKQMNKAKTGANAIGFVVALVIGLVFVNIVVNRVSARFDFTTDRVYTLSQASKDLVKQLPDRLTVKAYISNDLQPPFSQVAQYVRDMMDEYKNASNGKLVWEAIDPGSDQKLEEEATKMKVPKVRRGRVSSNKVEIGASYLGLSFQFGGQVEAIPEINSQEGLEFEVTSLIKRMTVKKKKIAFAASEGELSTGGDPSGGAHGGGGLQIVSHSMGQYDIVPVQLNQGDKPIPDDADALVIVHPKQPFSERAKFVIDQFLMKGKSVALFESGMVIEAPKQMQIPGMDGQPRIGRKNDTGLDDLLDFYGFKVRDDIILEPRQNVPGPVPVGGQMFLANYPTFVASTRLAEKVSVMERVEALILPFASSIERSKDSKQPNLKVTELASSTPDAWRQSGFFLFDPQNQQLKVGEDKGPFVFAVQASGKFKSFFAGKPYPDAKGEKVAAPDPNSSVAPGAEKPLEEGVADGRLILVSNGDFASDDYLRFGRQIPTYAGNLQFFMNAIDWLAQDETLALIRAKGVQSRPLKFEKESTPTVVQFANIIGVPFVFILFGVVRWRLRSARRRTAHL